MDKNKVAQRNGRARRVFNVSEIHSYIDEKYTIKLVSGGEITPTGYLVVGTLSPKHAPEYRELPSFGFRWDEKDNALDIDPVNVSEAEINEFRKGTGDCHGHHTKKISSSPRIYDVDIKWGGEHIYSGQIGFNLGREVESSVAVGLAVSGSYEGKVKGKMYSVAQAASTLGLSVQHVRHLVAKGEIAGKRLGRDWVVLSLDYKRKRKPKQGGEIDMKIYFAITSPGKQVIPLLKYEEKGSEIEILECLRQEAATVDRISYKTGIDYSMVYLKFRQMKRNGWVKEKRFK